MWILFTVLGVLVGGTVGLTATVLHPNKRKRIKWRRKIRRGLGKFAVFGYRKQLVRNRNKAANRAGWKAGSAAAVPWLIAAGRAGRSAFRDAKSDVLHPKGTGPKARPAGPGAKPRSKPGPSQARGPKQLERHSVVLGGKGPQSQDQSQRRGGGPGCRSCGHAQSDHLPSRLGPGQCGSCQCRRFVRTAGDGSGTGHLCGAKLKADPKRSCTQPVECPDHGPDCKLEIRCRFHPRTFGGTGGGPKPRPQGRPGSPQPRPQGQPTAQPRRVTSTASGNDTVPFQVGQVGGSGGRAPRKRQRPNGGGKPQVTNHVGDQARVGFQANEIHGNVNIDGRGRS